MISAIRKKGIKVVIATDNMDAFARFTIPGMHLKSYFDGFLISHNLRTLKPDIGSGGIPFFDQYMREQRLIYLDCVLLDDSADVCSIYSGLGLKTIQITGTGSLLGALQKFAYLN